MSEEIPLDDPRQKVIGVRTRKPKNPGKVIWKRSNAPVLGSPIRTSGRKPTRIKRQHPMGLASCEIVGSVGGWRVSHDGKAGNVYQTRNLHSRQG